MAKALGLGLVGTGGFGQFCLGAYAELTEVQIVAVADIDQERARAVAPPGSRAYGQLSALLADSEVEIVAINTPPFLHGPMICEAANAGKHVFVEKPLATSMEEALTAVQATEATGVQLGINYVLRHHPLHELAARVIHSDALGEFQHWSLENFAADDNLVPGHWFWDRSQSGGIHVEHGVHFYDLCNHLVGSTPSQVTGNAQRRPDGRLDRVGATVRYGDRVLATFYHSFNQIARFERTTIRLGCSRGRLTIRGWIPTELELWGVVDDRGLADLGALFGDRLQARERFHGPEGTMHHGGTTDTLTAVVKALASAPDRQGEYRGAIQAGMKDLIGAIREGRPPRVSAEDAVSSLAVALAASDQ